MTDVLEDGLAESEVFEADAAATIRRLDAELKESLRILAEEEAEVASVREELIGVLERAIAAEKAVREARWHLREHLTGCYYCGTVFHEVGDRQISAVVDGEVTEVHKAECWYYSIFLPAYEAAEEKSDVDEGADA